jgi:hypothetical protein
MDTMHTDELAAFGIEELDEIVTPVEGLYLLIGAIYIIAGFLGR